MAEAVSARKRHAHELFAPLGPTYDRYASLLSFGQDPRWRRFLVSRVPVGGDETVLDVATGTGAIARELVRARGCAVVAVDQSAEMLSIARARVDTSRVRLVEANAEELPFEDSSFDALTFTYLLRYVDDPAAVLTELARVVRPGAVVAGLDFGVPPGPVPRALWNLYVNVGLPTAGRAVSPAWHEVGAFLGGSIRDFWRRWPLPRVLAAWREAGIEDVSFRRLSLGGGIVIWGRRT